MAYAPVTRAAIGIAFALSAACLNFDPFACADNTACDSEIGGACVGGFCSYPDPACDSNLKYDENAGMDLAGTCVLAGGSTGMPGDDGDDDPTGSDQTDSGSSDDIGVVDDTSDSGDTAEDTASETGEPMCGGAGEACCDNQTCSAGLACLGSGCSCVDTIAAGNRHTCVIKLDGTVHCWGSNSVSQLGQPMIEQSLTPVEVPGPFGAGMLATDITARDHTCVLRDDAFAYCWGDNALGQVDPASGFVEISNPTIAGFASGAINLGTGASHTCVARNTGTSSTCWGDNTSNQLTSVAAGPTPVDNIAGVQYSQIEPGDDFTCAAQITGAVTCWGNNALGQLANDIVTVPSSATPVPASVGGNAARIVVGGQHACAQVGNQIYCWGRGDLGQLGNGLNTNSAVGVVASLPPAVVPAQLAAGPNHTCIVSATDELYCWGSNDNGQLMLSQDKKGNDMFTLTPVMVEVGAPVLQVATGATHTCVLTDAGEILCWGSNFEGQLGDGTTNYGFDPTPALLTCP